MSETRTESEGGERLVEKVAWGIHYARGYESPRQVWAGMDAEDKALLLAEARAVLSLLNGDKRDGAKAGSCLAIRSNPRYLGRSDRSRPAGFRAGARSVVAIAVRGLLWQMACERDPQIIDC